MSVWATTPVNISKVALELAEKKISFSESAQYEIGVLSSSIREITDLTVDAFCTDSLEMQKKVEPLQRAHRYAL